MNAATKGIEIAKGIIILLSRFNRVIIIAKTKRTKTNGGIGASPPGSATKEVSCPFATKGRNQNAANEKVRTA